MESSNVIEIAPVQRSQAKVILGFAGQSGEGKTYSALQVALGLAGGEPTKIGLLDCEQNRGSLYSDIFEEKFMHGNLSAPFSPARYIAAMRQFAASGIEVLVIDSVSHEHEGQGGLEEIANAPKANGEPRKIADWLTAKREHRRFMNTLLFLPCHVIACFRAREKFDFKNPKEPKSLGLQPITEKNVMYEMTASFMLRDEGRIHDIIKLPECLRHILGQEGYFTPDHGLELREWVGGLDPIERAKNLLRLAAGEGMASLGAAWQTLDKPTQKQLSAFKDTLKDGAAHADKERGAVRPDSGAPDEDAPDIKW